MGQTKPPMTVLQYIAGLAAMSTSATGLALVVRLLEGTL